MENDDSKRMRKMKKNLRQKIYDGNESEKKENRERSHERERPMTMMEIQAPMMAEKIMVKEKKR